ncbi:MAG: alcohol dehydrogenase catalytic domain-containing protein [Pseudomonadota bacterium]|nr:alcohol dehydrogenase catalytic domain-containing protein [Pseudomonadota bacterium]
MKAAVLHEVGQALVIEDVSIDKLGPPEVLVRTEAARVCHSDLHFVEGLYPRRLPVVLGYESAGVFEEVVTYVKPGDHIITCLSAFCGHCEACTTGHPSICDGRETRRRRDQPARLYQEERTVQQFANLPSFAEQMLFHEHALLNIRDDMPLDKAALIGCGVTTGVEAVHNTVKVEVGLTVTVIGCGGVGLSCINGAAIAWAVHISQPTGSAANSTLPRT